MKVESVVAYCPACRMGWLIYAGDPYVNHMGIRGYAMKCENCSTRWTEPIAEMPVRTEASCDDGPITQPCVAPIAAAFCWRCGRAGEKSQYAERLWCRDCGTWLDEFRPEVA